MRPLKLPGRSVAPLEFIDGLEQQRLVVRELERHVLAAARGRQRDVIARTDVLLDELARERAHRWGTQGMHAEVVQHDHVKAPFGVFVGRDVGLDGLAREGRAFGRVGWNVHELERGNGLRLAVLFDLKVVLRQIADQIPVGVHDADIHQYGVHVAFEGRSGKWRQRPLRFDEGGR